MEQLKDNDVFKRFNWFPLEVVDVHKNFTVLNDLQRSKNQIIVIWQIKRIYFRIENV